MFKLSSRNALFSSSDSSSSSNSERLFVNLKIPNVLTTTLTLEYENMFVYSTLDNLINHVFLLLILVVILLLLYFRV